ncbi:hypothetical protein DEU56DRAFT_917274 [Suillus clintonianus]|uniref:uncharacterized protein n=1 Tax=Suillus clintonianus TaxID=1904413 RepID=UPI001B87B6C5|nr:uncharacterized protein DEU56DRAFT_917274 [Suillus clintonianus]KAG2123867.1 hypothetical protein DEU56DRAFT_917274 [Suillus clintonianus]
MPDIIFMILQMVYTAISTENSGRLGAFAGLATTSLTISEAVLHLLWKQLSSVEPLIHLLPEDLIYNHQDSNGGFELVEVLRTLKPSDLARFYSYARRVKAICPEKKALRSPYKHVFQSLLALHGRIRSLDSLLPFLIHVELKHKRDRLIQFLDSLLHPGLTTLILPPHMLLPPDIHNLLPHLQNLVYIANSSETRTVLNSLSLSLPIRYLTLSYVEPAVMTSISSLRWLTILTLVIIPGSSSMKQTSLIPNHHIRTRVLDIRVEPDECPPTLNHSMAMSADMGFPAIISLFSNHPITMKGLSINVHQEYCSADAVLHFFDALISLRPADDDEDALPAWEDLVGLRLKMPWEEGFFVLDESVLQIPRHGLAALYALAYLTALELEDLGTCRIDDDALLNLALSLPYLKHLFLGTGQFWEEAPRATLWGISHILSYCRSLQKLGLLFYCSLGQHLLESAARNTLITTLHVGFSPPHSSVTVAAFFAHSLPNLNSIMVEPRGSHSKHAHSRTDLTLPDREARIQEWDRILELTREFAEL